MVFKQCCWCHAAAIAGFFIVGAFTRNGRADAGESTVVTIKMRDMPASFLPNKVTIKSGDTVQWINVGNSIPHAPDDSQAAIKPEDVSPPSGGDSFDSGFLQPGERF